MKEKYINPVIIAEELEKTDVLCASNVIDDDNSSLDYSTNVYVLETIPGMD